MSFIPVIVMCAAMENQAPIPTKCVSVENTNAIVETYTACQFAAADMTRSTEVFSGLRNALVVAHGETRYMRFFVTCQDPENMDLFMQNLPAWITTEMQRLSAEEPQDT